MSRKVVHNHPENFETIVLEKLIEFSSDIKRIDAKLEGLDEKVGGLDAKVGGLDEKVGGLGSEMRAVKVQVGGLTERLDEIDARGKKTYDIMVELVGDSKVDREERLFLTHRVRDNEERLEVVESALAIKPAARAF